MYPTMHLILTAIVLFAAGTDLLSQRIPNALTYPAMLLALSLHGMTNGLDGLLFSFSGLALGLGVMLIPYLIGVMGAGDVKLMAVVGGFLGTGGVIDAFLLTTLFGGVYAVIILLSNISLFRDVLASIWGSLILFHATKHFEYAPTSASESLPKLCYGVAIAAGTMCTMILAATNTPLWLA